jgi:adenosylhomocysteine nucleosidase
MMLRWFVQNLIRQTAREGLASVMAGGPGRESAATESAATESAASEAVADQPPPLPPCDVAVLMGTDIEAEGLFSRLARRVTTRCASFVEHAGLLGERSAIVAETGTAERDVARATEDVIQLHRPPWIVSAGFAGSLSPAVDRGHFLMADHVVDLQGRRLSVGLGMDSQTLQARRGLHVGRLLTVDRLLRGPEEKAELGRRHEALACDMETMVIAEICRQHKVRFLAVRVITEGLDERLPVELERMFAQKTIAGKLGAATGAILRRPGAVKDWWKFQQEALQASQRLAKFLRGIVAQLTVERSS